MISMNSNDIVTVNIPGGMWNAYEQAKANCGKHELLLLMKKNHKKPLIVMDAEAFMDLVKRATEDLIMDSSNSLTSSKYYADEEEQQKLGVARLFGACRRTQV